MRYRLMASYLGASYQAAVGPSDMDVTLFAAPPPPEEHGFSPAPGGIWRKQVVLGDVDALWESRPIGSYHGEPCLVLDDLGDRLHIVYLGMDERRAGQLGYWQVDRGVFEVVVPRQEVTDLAEERHEFPLALLLSTLPRALNAADPGVAGAGPGGAPGGLVLSGPAVTGPAMTGAGGGPARGGAAGGQQQFPGPRQLPAAAPPPAPVTGAYQVAGGVPQGPLGSQGPGGPAGQGGRALTAPQVTTAQQMNSAQHLGTGQQAGMAPQAGTAPQAGGAQQANAQQFPGAGQLPGAVQSAAAGQFSGQPLGQQGAVTPQLPNVQPPTAVAAWHGSPAPDGAGPWYYQQNGQPGQGRSGTVSSGVAGQAQYPAAGQPAPGQPFQSVPQGFPAAQQGQPPTAVQPVQALSAPTAEQVQYQAAPPALAPQAPPAQPAPLPVAQPQLPRPQLPRPQLPQPQPQGARPAADQAASASTGPLAPLPTAQPPDAGQADQAPHPGLSAATALSKLTGAVRGRRAQRKPRLAMSAIFAELVDMADIPRSAYSVDEEVIGAMCLFKTDGGYEVFNCAEDARLEVRFFEDEESAYFYLFGVLAAEALRNGRLSPQRG